MRVLVKEPITHSTTEILDSNNQAYRISLLRILQNFQSKRAVADIIVTLLLVAITVVTGIIMFVMVQDTGISESITSEASKPLTFEGGIKLSAYDARDGANLMGLTDIDNSVIADNGELIAGEYIVLKITNNSPNSIFLNDVIVNEVSHIFDPDPTLPPASSQFSIIPGTDDQGTTPLSSSEIGGGVSVRVVVKLGSMSDISINEAIRVKIYAIGFDLQNFIITAGHAR